MAALPDMEVFLLDREIHDKHRAHWNEETIQQFRTGESWSILGDSFDFSYNLAQILWRKIETDLSAPRNAILQFITDATAEDGGEAAFQSIFELSLGELVMDFLGEGPWTPEPDKWAHNPAVAAAANDDGSLQAK